ncbi:hypothetical protein TCAL_04597 [Tigriopus californicus]|uniref:RING-type domain-containing protein n=1 Tax=Tigriopus californicus TaxID=6832 RepID=A0A553PA75_TIGCA|nr:protein neuralized-like [Tigriopus californicus]TRY74580.1 hypothetical protein TCAL_04597 [Tigriopus californicus]|eukprot:TCALIF_04597-PA protein Name:"Similar to neur Protein neuralized (Drosophila melanogaster)" AED:0.00 eAED:0.00 QI:465/1/1/1/0/0.5/2/173/574
MGERRTKKPGKLKKVLQGVTTAVRITMGNAHSKHLTQSLPPINMDAPPLKFHRKRGDNITLEAGGYKARRRESFCKGIVFSDRPVALGEWVCLRLTDLSDRWNGVVRVGFTNRNPALLGALPKYACPTLTSQPGYWAKALSERYTDSDSVIHYFVAGNGDVHFGAGGMNRGVFFSGVDTRQPLWAMIDLYGNCTGLELVDLRSNLNNYAGISPQNTSDSQAFAPVNPLQQRLVPPPDNRPSPFNPIHRPLEQPNLPQFEHPPPYQFPPQQPSHQPWQRPPQHPTEPVQVLSNHMNDLSLHRPPTSHAQPYNPPNYRSLVSHREVSFRPQSFHFCTGKNAILNESSQVASRNDDEFAQGYVFTGAPIRPGERIVLQVLKTEDSYIGSLAFGLTNCDPSSIDTRELPEDSDMLLDRPEYWVVSKDVANSPSVGDELSFGINPDGTVEFSKNASPSSVFMHVDTSLRLWAFWDIYGHTSKVRILGSTSEPVCSTVQPNLPGDGLTNRPAQRECPNEPLTEPSECTICFERRVDCAVYRCGHMCMCYACAIVQWQGPNGGYCPLCRQAIQDVMRVYRA